MQTFSGTISGGQFAQVINNYYNDRDYWVSCTNEQLKEVIKNTKQRKKQANWHKWTHIPVLLGLFLIISATLVLGVNLYLAFSDYSQVGRLDNTLLYIVGTLIFCSTGCFYVSQDKIRRTQIFINHCNQLIDLCEQLIFERQYD